MWNIVRVRILEGVGRIDCALVSDSETDAICHLRVADCLGRREHCFHSLTTWTTLR